ncbi:MAG: cellulase family glycosylhydrolase [Micropruina sp.]|uniref:glycoside hydrolase family 5 protein n=1 Tax=Micropruina sp. TaxID=2737536 RepID=UPI0039E6D1F9
MDPVNQEAHPVDRPFGRRALLAAGIGILASPILGGCGSPAPTRFEAVDGIIRGLDGATFTPLGANVGTVKTFDWKGDARGHAADAVAWGWNTVRLNLMVTDAASWSYVANRGADALLDLASEIVDEYTGAGLVVILDAHDNPRSKDNDQAAVESQLISWWTTAAARFRDNPRVWCGLLNEPDYLNDEWVRILDTLASAVRGTGNANPILLGAPCWGQDLGPTEPYFAGAKFSYQADMAPALQRKHGNVILEQHNYGAYEMYSTADKLAGYVAKVREAGLTPLIGEFGYTVDRSSTAGSFAANYAGAQAVLEVARNDGVGALWWHATHGDKYSLKADGTAFWTGGPDHGLSDGGSRLWQLGHQPR